MLASLRVPSPPPSVFSADSPSGGGGPCPGLTHPGQRGRRDPRPAGEPVTCGSAAAPGFSPLAWPWTGSTGRAIGSSRGGRGAHSPAAVTTPSAARPPVPATRPPRSRAPRAPRSRPRAPAPAPCPRRRPTSGAPGRSQPPQPAFRLPLGSPTSAPPGACRRRGWWLVLGKWRRLPPKSCQAPPTACFWSRRQGCSSAISMN